MVKVISLLKAFTCDQGLPDGGVIVSSYLDSNSNYSIFEITAYGSVGDVCGDQNGLSFKCKGNRLHILVEPEDYDSKEIEPSERGDGRSIPYRFSELDIIDGKNRERIMMPRAHLSMAEFTVPVSTGDNYSFLFFPSDSIGEDIKKFIADVLYNDSNMSKKDALNVSDRIYQLISKFEILK
jgi:hypothetical protein